MPQKGKKSNTSQIGCKKAISLFTTMAKIRAVEETLVELFGAGEIPGFIHACIGQEAAPAAVCSQLNPTDYITTSHRGHGHALAKGVDLKAFMAELFGKRDGLCRGRSGSIHLADKNCGLIGANGIVGAGIPLATGAAFAARYQGDGRVTACFFGDAATDQGVFHESLNMASLWKLPIVYVCENNGWAQFTPQAKHMLVSSVSDKAAAYQMEGITVKNDVKAIEVAAGKAIAKARKGGGPTLLEVKSSRWHGHYVGDPQHYRDKQEVAQARKDDCLKTYRAWLVKSGTLQEKALADIERSLAAEIAEAVAFARQSPFAEPSELMENLYAG